MPNRRRKAEVFLVLLFLNGLLYWFGRKDGWQSSTSPRAVAA